MKYRVNELINRYNKNNKVEGVINYKNKIGGEIVDVDDTAVKGTFDYIKSQEMFAFKLHISTTVTSLCAITSENVKVLVDFDTDLFYTFKVSDDDSFPIINNIIDMDEEIWGEIILHMPIRVIKEGASFTDEESEIVKDSPFKELLYS